MFFKERGHFWVQKFVTTFGNSFRKFLRKGRAAASNEHRTRNSQVKHFLCWAQWLLGIAIASANVVICVMDETMIPWNFWGRKGNVVKVRKEDAQHVFTENVADAKACMTLIATICNDPNLQKHLKQILMPKGRKLKDSDEFHSTWPNSGMPTIPDNIIVWQKTSGWCSTHHIVEYMKILRRTIQEHRPGATIVLAYDCCPAHIGRTALRYSAQHLGHVILFPGQLGWMFDIMDTKVFNGFKSSLHEDSKHARMASPTGVMSKHQWAEVVFRNIDKHITQANYASEFARHGLATDSTQLRDPIKKILDPSLTEPPRKLTVPELHELMGMKRGVHNLLFDGARYSHLNALGHPYSGASSSSSSVASSSSSRPMAPAHGTFMPFRHKLKLTSSKK